MCNSKCPQTPLAIQDTTSGSKLKAVYAEPVLAPQIATPRYVPFARACCESEQAQSTTFPTHSRTRNNVRHEHVHAHACQQRDPKRTRVRKQSVHEKFRSQGSSHCNHGKETSRRQKYLHQNGAQAPPTSHDPSLAEETHLQKQALTMVSPNLPNTVRTATCLSGVRKPTLVSCQRHRKAQRHAEVGDLVLLMYYSRIKEMMFPDFGRLYRASSSCHVEAYSGNH